MLAKLGNSFWAFGFLGFMDCSSIEPFSCDVENSPARRQLHSAAAKYF
jgi:hypothetical protein